ncbi:NYN domain-containing protein [Rhizobiaceae bacterium n13]|uniref:NYN domain-containing protein n=1 Tax=Ferirhizobium litorale TaxID=2927786 RepID=UPI0024B2E79D|nr:NYN domain-containing protein [Fererhizobium litorale]MDI7862377.1 NYN domain-containing protein [Fererhizobium litorale]
MRDIQSGSLAVLIDGDNISPTIISSLLKVIAGYGTVSVKRIYGDWTSPHLTGWKQCLLEHAIQPVQQFAYTAHKNATDGTMFIDAMDLLYTGRFSGFCIVSSDSDFTRLAARIREQGISVYGFGERHTPRPFVTTCDSFVYLDELRTTKDQLDFGGVPIGKIIAARQIMAAYRPAKDGAAPAKPDLPTRRSGRLDDAVLRMLETAVMAMADASGRATLASVGMHLASQSPDFNVRHYGFARLSDLAEASGILDVERVGSVQQNINVRLKIMSAHNINRNGYDGTQANRPADR